MVMGAVRRVTCKGCGEKVEKSEATNFLKNNYCRECHDELFFTCEDCDKTCNRDNINVIDDGNFCEPCFSRNYVECVDCSNSVRYSNAYSVGFEHACQECYEDNYFVCQGCDDVCPNDTMSDSGICEDCSDNRKKNKLNSYVFQPIYEFHKMPWENTLYLGIELEVNCEGKDRGALIDKFLDFLKVNGWENYLYLKDDCSIGLGFEIVSHPFTLQAKHRKINWYKILKWLAKNGFNSYESGKCGLHVHVSRNELSFEAKSKIMMFVNNKNHRKALEKFSKREDYQFCKFETYGTEHYKADRKYKAVSQQERGAVYLKGTKPTIEYRLFRGTLAYPRFMASLQFAEACTLFCKEWSIAGVAGISAWGDFKKWARRTGRYSHMVSYFDRNKI